MNLYPATESQEERYYCPACDADVPPTEFGRRFVIPSVRRQGEPIEVIEHAKSCGKWLWRKQIDRRDE